MLQPFFQNLTITPDLIPVDQNTIKAKVTQNILKISTLFSFAVPFQLLPLHLPLPSLVPAQILYLIRSELFRNGCSLCLI